MPNVAAVFFGQVKAVAKLFTPDCVVNMGEAGREFAEPAKLVSPLYPLRFLTLRRNILPVCLSCTILCFLYLFCARMLLIAWKTQ